MNIFCRDIWNIICDYIDGDITTTDIERNIKKWIKNFDLYKSELSNLCRNPSAIYFIKRMIENNLDLDWKNLSLNENILYIFDKNFFKIDWDNLCINEGGISIIEDYIKKYGKINLSKLCSNKNAIHIIKKYQLKIDWKQLSKNTNIEAIELLEKNKDKIYWKYLSGNKSAIKLIEKNLELVDWDMLILNENMDKLNIDLLENIDKRDLWNSSCLNGSLMNIIEKILDEGEKNKYYHKIDDRWIELSCNPSINIEKYNKNLYWYFVSRNPALSSVDIIEKNIDKINWKMLSSNRNYWKKYLDIKLRKYIN